MRATRAAIAVGMLVGFYIVAAGIVIGLAVAGWGIGHAVGLKMIIVAGVVGFVVLRAVLVVSRSHQDSAEAEEVRRQSRLTGQDQPELWAEVVRLADAVGTRPPDEIHLVPEVNAAVKEDASVLGLRGGKRTLLIGIPLLVGLTANQLRAVLAHELGHYSGAHTRLGPLTYRGRVQIGRTIDGLRDHPILRRVFHGYALLYLLVSQRVSRDQEYEADAAAARLTSADDLVATLRELPVLTAAWEHYLESYVGWAANAGVRPRAVVGGFRRMLTDPGRAEALAALRAREPADTASRYDSHPTFAQRKAALAGIPAPERPADDRTAVALLANPDEVMERANEAHLVGDLKAMPPLPWEEITPLAGQVMVRPSAARVQRVASTLLGEDATIDGVIALLGDPQRFAAAMVEDLRAQQISVEPGREVDMLIEVVEAYFAAAGVEFDRLAWQLSWSGGVRLVDFAGEHVGFEAAVRAAIENSDAAALRDLLGRAGVPGDLGLTGSHRVLVG